MRVENKNRVGRRTAQAHKPRTGAVNTAHENAVALRSFE